MKPRWYIFWLPLALVLIVGCRPNAPAAPVEPRDDPAFTQPQTVDRPGIDESDEEAPTKLHPGDVVSLKVLGNDELDAPKVVVDRAGYVHLSLIGDVRVGGLSLGEAESAILENLRRYDRFSEVSLQLVDTASRTVAVTGAVEKPGNVVLLGDARLAQVLAEAGGPRMVSDGDKLVQLGDVAGARLVRDGEIVPVDFRQALLGHPRHNVRVRPGDVVVVPPAVTGRIVLLGNLNKPRTLTFREGLRLSEALAEAGGLSEAADAQDVRILRGGYAQPKLYVANAKLFFEGKRPDPLLAPGDIVYVSKHWTATAGEIIDKVVPAVATAAVISTLAKD